jgi:hypothetical protein
MSALPKTRDRVMLALLAFISTVPLGIGMLNFFNVSIDGSRIFWFSGSMLFGIALIVSTLALYLGCVSARIPAFLLVIVELVAWLPLGGYVVWYIRPQPPHWSGSLALSAIVVGLMLVGLVFGSSLLIWLSSLKRLLPNNR